MSRFRGCDHVRLRLVVATLVGLLVMVATSAVSRADDAPPPRAATLSYGPEPHQLLDLQRPDPNVLPGPRPVVVYLHAGGWIGGDRTEVPDMVTAQVARGFVLASVDYRLATVDADGQPVPSFPGAIWDVKRAVRYVKANSATWGIDLDRVVLAGASAGGHLAAFVGATPGRFEPPDVPATREARRDSSVQGIVDFVGPADLATFGRSGHPWAAPVTAAFLGCARPSERDPLPCPPDRLGRASVATYVDRTAPPIFLAYGALDTLVVPATQGEPMVGIWRDVHGGDPDSASYLEVESAGHTLSAEDTQGPITAFLDRVTGRAGAAARPVTLYGDSLASEAQTHFKAALASAGITDVHARTFGGTALCDWLDEMRADAADFRPRVAVVEFSGNAFTPCMRDASGAQLRGDAYYAKYHDDAVEALRTFSATNTRVIFVGAPVSRRAVEERRRDAGRLNAVYASLAAVGGAEYADAGAAVLDRGRFTAALECLPAEPCTGGTDASGTPINAVRAPDGVHFCPAAPEAIDGVTGECPVWSSGAFRFGPQWPTRSSRTCARRQIDTAAANEPRTGRDILPPGSDRSETLAMASTPHSVSGGGEVGQWRRMEGWTPRVEFCVLGPLGVVVKGQPVPLGSPKLRTVLAALLVDANSVVSSDRLIDILWGDDPPATAKTTLQKLVYRLRLLVEPNEEPDRLLVTRAPGYVLLVGPNEYDAARFETWLQTARAEADRGRVSGAVATLDEALGLWRGPAFAEFAYDDFARPEATRLEELRVSAVEDRVDAKLALGRHEELIGELERTVDAHPLRERSRAQLMLALYRAGRQVEALRAYQDHRRYLVEELGLEPSTALRSLEAAIVVQAAELDYERSPFPNGNVGSGAAIASFPPPSVPAALGEAEITRAFDDRITRATATRIDLDLLEDELADNVMELHRLSEPQRVETMRTSASERCPYKGLAPFESTDADYFFGRERLVAELVARVAVERFVAVVGVSGSGKSSLLLAGLCPALHAGALPGSEEWLTVLLTPGVDPLERLARALAGAASGLSLDILRARLRDDPEALEHVARDALAAKPRGSRLVVVVDQFEELFTMCRDDELRRRFVDGLARSVGDPRVPVSVVVAVRADYYARCAALTDLAPLFGSTVLVGTMTDRELCRAIEEPARRVGLRLEPGLTDAILTDVGEEPGGLPLLSTALLETWVRRHDSTLTLAGYENAGGVTGALTHLAESVYQQFGPDERESCRRILLRLAEPGEGDDDVRRRALADELVAPDDPSATTVLATLTDRRLVTAGADGVEVAHEALLREWPRARAWLEDDRDGRRLHHHLAASAVEWEAAGRDPAELYRGARLASALDWSAAHPGVANRLEGDFLETASAADDAELRTARRGARRLRALLAATAVLLVVAIVAGSVSLVQRGEARDRARAAELTRLATQAATLPPDQLGRALLLGVEVRRLDRSEGGVGALEAALAGAPAGLERLIPVPGGVGYAGVSPDGRRLVTGGRDGKVRIVDVPSGRIVRTLDPGPGDVGADLASFSSDGNLVVVARVFLDGTPSIQVFDAHSGRSVGPRLQGDSGITLARFLPNDPTVLVTVGPNELIRWDLSDPERPRRLGAALRLPENLHSQGLTLFTISPDGRTALTSAAGGSDLGADGSTFVWDLESGARLFGPLDGRPGPFTPDGTQLTLRRPDHIAFVDAATGADRGTLSVGFTSSADYIISGDGRRLAVSSADGDTRVFDLASTQQIGQSLTSFAESSLAGPLAFLPGDRLLVGSQNEAAVWRYVAAAPVFATRLPGRADNFDARFTPDGTEIVVTEGQQLLRSRARDGRPLGRVLDLDVAPSSRVAFSPDASTVAVPEADGTVSLWDRRTGRRQSVLRTGQAGEVGVAWSPAGSVVATVSRFDRALVLWDVSDPRDPKERHRLANGDVVNVSFRHPMFSTDGRVVAVNDYPASGQITFVDVARGRVIRTRTPGGPGGQIASPLNSPDGETMVTMRFLEGELKLLDAATGRVRATRQVNGFPTQWAFVHGGRRIAILSVPSAAVTGPTTFELWDATTLESVGERVTFAMDAGGLGEGDANPDGTKLVSHTERGAVLWDLDPENWEQLACRIAGRNLTRAEWNQYLPGRDYHRTCPT